MKKSDLAMSLATAISHQGIKAIERPKYLQHIKKTIVIKFKESQNGKVIYIDEMGNVMQEYPKTFNCDVFNPPILGITEEYEMTVDKFHKWENDIIDNPEAEYQPPQI